jgi:CoA:oxalate CoA-transferase
MNGKPLSDITILDLTWVLSGPYASMVLCDLGAEVIKIEKPPFGDVSRTNGPYQNGWSGYFFSINRGKRSVGIDLRTKEGREIFLELATGVDVVVENFTPGTMDRLGIGYDTLSKLNSGLVFASISGFGQTGPYRHRPALDIIVQAMGGVLSITGEPEGPPVRPGISYGDISAGLFTVIGILSALHERESSGLGQSLDISMLDCQVSVMENAIMRYGITGDSPKPLGTRHPTATPFQAFPTADRPIVIALGFQADEQWALLCGLIGLSHLIDDTRFNTGPKRTKHHQELEPLLIQAFKMKPAIEWLTELEAVGIPCGPVNSIPEVIDDPQVKHRGMIQEVTHNVAGTIPIANTPFRYSRSETGISGPPPSFGADTEAILNERLGLSKETLATLKENKVISTSGDPDIESLLH